LGRDLLPDLMQGRAVGFSVPAKYAQIAGHGLDPFSIAQDTRRAVANGWGNLEPQDCCKPLDRRHDGGRLPATRADGGCVVHIVPWRFSDAGGPWATRVMPASEFLLLAELNDAHRRAGDQISRRIGAAAAGIRDGMSGKPRRGLAAWIADVAMPPPWVDRRGTPIGGAASRRASGNGEGARATPKPPR
jgi:hypothetical protein